MLERDLPLILLLSVVLIWFLQKKRETTRKNTELNCFTVHSVIKLVHFSSYDRRVSFSTTFVQFSLFFVLSAAEFHSSYLILTSRLRVKASRAWSARVYFVVPLSSCTPTARSSEQRAVIRYLWVRYMSFPTLRRPKLVPYLLRSRFIMTWEKVRQMNEILTRREKER